MGTASVFGTPMIVCMQNELMLVEDESMGDNIELTQDESQKPKQQCPQWMEQTAVKKAQFRKQKQRAL